MTLVDTIPITSPRDVASRAVATVSAPHNDLKALETVIFELCLNVKQWAEADGNVFVEEEESRFVITVQDHGVGIPATMRRAFSGLSNEEAVARALAAGGTSSGQKWRGFGLADATDMSNREGFSVYLETQDVAIWSVDGALTFGYKSEGAIAGTRIQIIYSGPLVGPSPGREYRLSLLDQPSRTSTCR